MKTFRALTSAAAYGSSKNYMLIVKTLLMEIVTFGMKMMITENVKAEKNFITEV